jgi:hypothetical protein
MDPILRNILKIRELKNCLGRSYPDDYIVNTSVLPRGSMMESVWGFGTA